VRQCAVRSAVVRSAVVRSAVVLTVVALLAPVAAQQAPAPPPVFRAGATGIDVDTHGDAFFCAFPIAPGALAAAAEMTEALSEITLRVPGRFVRAGVNVLSLAVAGGGRATLDRLTLERAPSTGSAR